MKLRKNDEIIVTRGKEKGKTGKVETVMPADSKVLIPGLNEYKRHTKGRGQGQKSEIVTFSRPLNVANVALVCPNCKKQTRIGFRMEKDQKVRFCKKCEKTI